MQSQGASTSLLCKCVRPLPWCYSCRTMSQTTRPLFLLSAKPEVVSSTELHRLNQPRSIALPNTAAADSLKRAFAVLAIPRRCWMPRPPYTQKSAPAFLLSRFADSGEWQMTLCTGRVFSKSLDPPHGCLQLVFWVHTQVPVTAISTSQILNTMLSHRGCTRL